MKKAPPVRISLRKLFVAMFMGTLLTAGPMFSQNIVPTINNVNNSSIATGSAIVADTEENTINAETHASTLAQGLVLSKVTDANTNASQFVSADTANTGAARFNASDGYRLRGHDPAGIKGTITSTAPTLAINTAVIGNDSKATIEKGNAPNSFGALSWHRTQVVINNGVSTDQLRHLASTGGLATTLA